MKNPSLRLRLMLLAGASIALALLIAGLGIYFMFAGHVERATRADLNAQMDRLVAFADPAAHPPTTSHSLADPRYSVPFGGMYWQIEDPETGESTRSRSMWDTTADFPDLSVTETLEQDIIDPEGTPALALFRRLIFVDDQNNSRTLDFMVAEDKERIAAAQQAFGSDLFWALLLLAAALVVANWIQIGLGLSPLNAIRRGIYNMRSTHSSSLDGNFPREVMPLVTEVNALMHMQEASIDFARARAADLAHGLKTSLTVLNAQAHGLRQKGESESADIIEDITNDMSATIDHQLKLSRLRFRTRSDHYEIPLVPTLEKVLATLGKTPRGSRINVELKGTTSEAVDMDAADLLELFGIVLDNAFRWAENRILIQISAVQDELCITIGDDGPGLDADQIALLGHRGKRLDEDKSGNGIGLSIAMDIVKLNRGEISYSRSTELGGLEVLLRLPVA